MNNIIALVTLIILSLKIHAQQKVENIIIITTDGLRWQELFKGMDSAIANNKSFNQKDSAGIFKKYWSEDENERRKKLMPFMWNTVAAKGQLYGNRGFDCKVDNSNPYWFSYPGYSEIFTGFADTNINSNEYPPNPNMNVLEFINQKPAYKNKTAVFGAWNAFDRILNEQRAGFQVVSAFDTTAGKNLSATQKLVNNMLKDSYKVFGESECQDVFTHYAALEYLKVNKPKVLYIAYGETDEWAHAGEYKSYLNAAHQVDQWIGDIWNFIQNDPAYKDKTALFITTDHGRGDKDKTQWTSHGKSIPDAHEIWFAVMSPQLPAKGEVKQEMQIYQKQFAKTIAALIGLNFTADHPVAENIKEIAPNP